MIPLLPTVSKIIEHCILVRTATFTVQYLSPLQFGSRKKYSAVDAVHLLLEIATHKARCRLFTSVLFMDVIVAFKKVLHKRLATIMTEAGFCPYLVD